MVKVFLYNHWKSFILEHFRAVKLEIFFNHGESIPQQSVSSWIAEAREVVVVGQLVDYFRRL